MANWRAYIPILAKLAVRRQAEVDPQTFTVYGEDLAAKNIPLEDVQAVCDRLGEKAREAYQTAFPCLGDILQPCLEIRRNRERTQLELAYREHQQRALAAPPMSDETAKLWLARIKDAAHKGVAK